MTANNQVDRGTYDPLDMNSYSLNRIPKRPLSPAGRFFRLWGLPIAALNFVVSAYLVQFPILDQRQQIMFGLFATALRRCPTTSRPCSLSAVWCSQGFSR